MLKNQNLKSEIDKYLVLCVCIKYTTYLFSNYRIVMWTEFIDYNPLW